VYDDSPYLKPLDTASNIPPSKFDLCPGCWSNDITGMIITPPGGSPAESEFVAECEQCGRRSKTLATFSR